MAQEQSGSLPQYYGQTMPDGTMVESPRLPLGSQGSRDALLRLPIQPNAAHVNHQDQEMMSPVSAMPNSPTGMTPAPAAGGNRSRARTMGDSNRWMVPFPGDADREEEYYHHPSQGRRRDPGSISHRSAYVEDYSDEEDRPRAYRRPARRHTRPPPAHGRFQNPRGSMDGGRSSYEYGYESDTPTKARVHASYGYGSEGEDARMYNRPRTSYGDGGGRGPPRNAPPPGEAMRLPWTMWMNSNAKNRRCTPYLRQRLRPRPSTNTRSAPPPFGIGFGFGPGLSHLPTPPRAHPPTHRHIPVQLLLPSILTLT